MFTYRGEGTLANYSMMHPLAPVWPFSWIHHSLYSTPTWFLFQHFARMLCSCNPPRNCKIILNYTKLAASYRLNFELSIFDAYSSFVRSPTFNVVFLLWQFHQSFSFLFLPCFHRKLLHFWVNRFVSGLIYLIHTLAHIHVQPSPPLYPQRDPDQSARPRSCVM